MKAEKVTFVNGHGFKEYGVRFKKSLLSDWEWVKNVKGQNILFSDKLADTMIKTLQDG